MSRITTHAGHAPALGGRLTRALAVALASCFAMLAMTGAPAMAADDSSLSSEPAAVVQQSEDTHGSDLARNGDVKIEVCKYYADGSHTCTTITMRASNDPAPSDDVEAVPTRR